MIRITTFVILAVFLAVASYLLPRPGGSENVVLYAILLMAWMGIYDLCNCGRFANYLGIVEDEAKQIAWLNRVQLLYNAKCVILLMAVLIIVFCCIDMLVTYLLF